jgi:hypothetical protein
LRRLAHETDEREERLVQEAEAEKCVTGSPTDSSATENIKQAVIQAALERAMAARARTTSKK